MTELLERLNCNLKTASFVLGSPEINWFACDQLWSTMETTGLPVIVLPLQSQLWADSLESNVWRDEEGVESAPLGLHLKICRKL